LNNVEITLKDLFALFMRRIKWIAIITALSVILAVFITLVFITPKFTATTSLFVSAYGENGNAFPTYAELTASKDLVPSYLEILKSNVVLSGVAEELGEEYTPAEIAMMMKAEGVGETQVMKISITSADPQEAMDVANAIANVAPPIIESIAKGGSVSPIDFAELPKTQSSPNLIVNVIVAFLIGLIISYLGFFIYESLDTLVRSEEDLTRNFNIPVFGSVPSLEENTDAKGGTAK
jgi:capsular polysaccharide biosynthesis protein